MSDVHGPQNESTPGRTIAPPHLHATVSLMIPIALLNLTYVMQTHVDQSNRYGGTRDHAPRDRSASHCR